MEKPEVHYKAFPWWDLGLRWDLSLLLIQRADKEGIDPFSNKAHLIDGQYVFCNGSWRRI